MEKYRKMTKIFTGGFVLIALIYDAYVIVQGGPESSISMLVIELSYSQPLVPFLVGVLCGHFFWRVKDNKFTKDLK